MYHEEIAGELHVHVGYQKQTHNNFNQQPSGPISGKIGGFLYLVFNPNHGLINSKH